MRKEYLALQNPLKKYLICAWKLSLNEGNFAIKIDGGRQKDSQPKSLIEELPLLKIDGDKHTDRQPKSLIEELRSQKEMVINRQDRQPKSLIEELPLLQITFVVFDPDP